MAVPEWARLAESRWPVEYSSTGVEEEGVMAETNNALLKEQGVFTSVGADNHCLLDLGNRCSSWWKILRIVARVLKFFKLLPRGAEISVTDMNRAELVLIKAIQRKYFNTDINLLKQNKRCSVKL